MKSLNYEVAFTGGKSPPARVVWIEIFSLAEFVEKPYVATREGGVD